MNALFLPLSNLHNKDCTTDNVYVEKVCINGNDGMHCRIETESFSNLEWWIKKDDCIVYLQLQGPGLLSGEVKADLISIVESLKSK